MKSRTGLVIMFAVVAIFTIAGCGSGGSSAARGGTTAPGAAKGQAATTSPATALGTSSGGGATGQAHAPTFNDLVAQWDGSGFRFQGKRLTFKAVYNGTTTSSTDCTRSAPNVTIEQNQDDSLITWPGCAEAISTPSHAYACELTPPVKCADGVNPNPFSSFIGQNLSASALLATFESEAPQFLTSAQTTYSNATYAGQPSKCVTYGYASVGTTKICVTSDGLLAFLGASTGSGPGSASSNISLASYNSSAPASDFALPAGAS